MCSVTEQSMPSYVLTAYYLINSDQFLIIGNLSLSKFQIWNFEIFSDEKKN